MNDNLKLPDFIIVGAVKGATTWIHAQLQAHPDIFLPDPEPHFFSTEYDRGFDHYAATFAEARPGQIIGEKSADYLAHPEAASRIAKVLPRIPMIAQLRNPVDRAYSDYKMLYRRGTVSGPPEEYLKPGSTQPRFLEDGLYARHLTRWLEHFDRDRLKVLLFEDVIGSPHDTVSEVCMHVGATPHFSETVGTKSRNDASERFLPLVVRSWLQPVKDVVKPLRGNVVFESVRGVFSRPIAYPPLRPETRDWLVDYYADDVATLAKLIGRNLDHWLLKRKLAA